MDPPPLYPPLDLVSTVDLSEGFEVFPDNLFSNGLSAGALMQTNPMVTSALFSVSNCKIFFQRKSEKILGGG